MTEREKEELGFNLSSLRATIEHIREVLPAGSNLDSPLFYLKEAIKCLDPNSVDCQDKFEKYLSLVNSHLLALSTKDDTTMMKTVYKHEEQRHSNSGCYDQTGDQINLSEEN